MRFRIGRLAANRWSGITAIQWSMILLLAGIGVVGVPWIGAVGTGPARHAEIGFSVFGPDLAWARPGNPADMPRFEDDSRNDHSDAPAVMGLSSGFFQDTVSYGGTWWAADSMRWEALRDSCWTFDSGVGSSINTGDNPDKPIGYHQAMEGWYGIDQTIHVDGPFRRSTTCAINGSWSLWSGITAAEANELCFGSGQGYGNSWNSTSSKTFIYPGAGTVSLSYKYAVDCEPLFDNSYVMIDTTGLGGDWESAGLLAQYTGVVSGTASFTLVRGVTMRSTPGPVRLLLVAESDGAYSDEDGLHPTVCGLAAYDDIVLGGAIVDTSTFESSDNGWQDEPQQYTELANGDFSGLADIADLPPPATFCPCAVRDSVLVFFDESGEHPLDQDNIAVSPWIDLRRGGDLGRAGRLMIYDLYAAMPLSDYVFVQLRARYYPEVCPATGLLYQTGWRDQNVVFYYGEAPFCSGPNAPRLRDFSGVIAQGAEQIQVGYGVINLCRTVPYSEICTGVTNTTPWIDNVSLGVYGAANVPLVSTLSSTRLQDNFASDGSQVLTSPGRIDVNRIKGNSTPVFGSVLGDTLTATCASTNVEVRLVFRVRPGPFTSAANLAARAARWTIEPTLDARYGGTWYSARMDTAEQAGVPTVGTWMTAFHEADPGFQVTDISIDPTDVSPSGTTYRLANDILPDNLFTPGSRIDYFLAARFAPPDPRNPGGTAWSTDPDTSGGYFREVEILPSSVDSSMTWNCTLYVDHHDDREFDDQRLEEAGLTMALGGGGNNAEGTRFDRFDVVNPSGAQMSLGRPNGTAYGMSILQSPMFKTIAWHSGSLPTGQLTNEDANVVNFWLTYAVIGFGFQDNRFWGSGEGLMQSMHTAAGVARSFMNNTLGVTQNCTSIRLAACPSGSVIDTTYCLPTAAVVGSDFVSSILPRARGNGCPQLRSFDVLNKNPASPNARGQLAWIKSGASVNFAAVTNSNDASRYRTVLDGMPVGSLRSNPGYKGVGCDDDMAARMRALDVMTWFDRRVNCPVMTSGVPDSVPPGPPGPPAPSVWISSLASARPNPWSPATRIAFTNGAAGGSVRIDLFDLTGRLVRTLVDGPQPTGPGEVTWDGRYADGRVAPQGLYFYQMMAGDGFRAVERLVVVR